MKRICSAITALVLIAAVLAPARLSADARRDARYLALGDSVSFGYITQAGFEYVNPDNFIAYADYAGLALRVDNANASCPGETTGSFLSTDAADNGCRGFRASAPLHVPYTSTQVQFATSFLRSHRDTRLVTVTLGANDVYLLENNCKGDLSCVEAGLSTLLPSIALNMRVIIAALRHTGYNGPVVVTNYYSTNYADAVVTQITQLLNAALHDAAAAEGALVADVFGAFKAAASNAFAAGQTCRAGLLNALPANQFLCDVHPSQSGQQLIAQAVEQSLSRR